jgi:hypothetical protein
MIIAIPSDLLANLFLLVATTHSCLPAIGAQIQGETYKTYHYSLMDFYHFIWCRDLDYSNS